MRTGRPEEPLTLLRRSASGWNRWRIERVVKRCWRGGLGWYWHARKDLTIKPWRGSCGVRWAWWASGVHGF